MHRPLLFGLLMFALLPSTAAWAKRACITPDDALQHLNKDTCIVAHVYRVVDAANGVHFLDVCSPQTADADCHFFILSYRQDKRTVDYLHRLAGQTIHIRGTVQATQGRADIVLSKERQLHGGKEGFQPNPRLVKGFSAEDGGQAFKTKNGMMGQHGVHFHHRGN